MHHAELNAGSRPRPDDGRMLEPRPPVGRLVEEHDLVRANGSEAVGPG